MAGWTVVVCPAPGRSTKRFRLGPAALALVGLLAACFIAGTAAIGWMIGERQSQSIMGGLEP